MQVNSELWSVEVGLRWRKNKWIGAREVTNHLCNMAMVISARSKLVTAAVVTGFGLALVLIIGSVVGWFDNRTFDHTLPSYGLHQRLAASNISQVRLDYLHKVPVILHENLPRGSHKPCGRTTSVSWLQLLRQQTNIATYTALTAETRPSSA